MLSGMGFIDIVLMLPVILFCITIHEYSHAYAAYRMGDSTAKDLGRLTLNPVSHIDLIGALMMILTGFGWASPVPINASNFSKYKKGVIIVSLAGSAANLAAGFVSLFLFYSVYKFVPQGWFGFSPLLVIFRSLAYINISFGVFNLLPIPPLDGFKILSVLMPYRFREKLFFMERNSFIILILFFLLFSSILTKLSGFVVEIYTSVIVYILNLI